MRIGKEWETLLKPEFNKDYFTELIRVVKDEYLNETIYPKQSDIFSAFSYTSPSNIKVIIIGQDPYHSPEQAHGLAFSVPDGVRVPPSLRNIYKEIHADIGVKIPDSGNLEHWAKQGVLLLNATLTVRAGEAGSHQKLGWEKFTDTVIETLSKKQNKLVFMLWGRYAKEKGRNIDVTKHLVLEAAHPSPLSAYNGFFGCKHFSQCNAYLIKNNQKPIKW